MTPQANDPNKEPASGPAGEKAETDWRAMASTCTRLLRAPGLKEGARQAHLEYQAGALKATKLRVCLTNVLRRLLEPGNHMDGNFLSVG